MNRYSSFYFRRIAGFLTGYPRRVALVGNGESACGHSIAIDSHDFVVRFNRATHYGSAGTKTDALAIINWSGPGHTMTTGITPINPDAMAAAREFWLPMPPEEMAEVKADQTRYHPWPGYVDFTSDVLEILVRGKPHIKFPPKIWRDLKLELRHLGAEQDMAASTGALVLAYVARVWPRSMFSLYGFTHEGWPGHPWLQEREWISRLSNVSYG